MTRLARRALRQALRESTPATWRQMLARSDPYLPPHVRVGWRLARALPMSRKLLAAFRML
jgi:hypothetical protein